MAFREGAPTEKLPGGQFFMAEYAKQDYAEPSEAYGPFAFAAMNLILDTIEANGPNRKKVRKALNAVKGHESIVGEVSFDGNGQNSVALITKYVIQDGKWTVWADSEYASGKRKRHMLLLLHAIQLHPGRDVSGLVNLDIGLDRAAISKRLSDLHSRGFITHPEKSARARRWFITGPGLSALKGNRG